MDDEKRKLMIQSNLTNSDLEAIYKGSTSDGWMLTNVVDSYEGPDDWFIVEFKIINSDQKYRGHSVTARVYYKICGIDDPYGHEEYIWESDLLGERGYPW